MSGAFGPNDVNSPFLPTTRVFPEDPSQLLIVLTNMYSSIAQSVNQREISAFNLNEQLNGQNFYNPANVQIPRQCFRQCFILGAIAPGASQSIATGLTGVTIYVHMYGGVVTGSDFRPIPYSDPTLATNQIGVLVSGPNVIVSNGSTAPAITSGFLILEFLKN